MKKLILTILLLTGIQFWASAQFKEQKTPSEKASSLSQTLQKQLNLSSNQAGKVNQILYAQYRGLDSVQTTGAGLDKKELYNARKLILDQTKLKLDSVFTDEQKSAYASFIQQQKDKRAAKKNGGFASPFHN